MFLILYNNFIPISLYVTIELVNVGQGFLISSDVEMYDEDLDCPCIVRSSNLAQELGMVSNVFSDKTGTLTRNEMKFVKFITAGVPFDVPRDINDGAKVAQQAVRTAIQRGGGNASLVYQFLRCLTACHTVVREKNGTYRAESPDELALVEGVAAFECSLLERSTTTITVQMLGETQVYEVLAVNVFNSDRKRMSIVVRYVQTGEYFVMCKGADNIMLPLCTIDPAELRRVEKSLLDLACLGLRTLCVAQKPLSEQYASAWLLRYRAAAASLTNRAEELAKVAEELETDMTLLGVTAIEDRLQDEVPEVIADLAKAGIIVWMLTGDKEETAVNIGHSCNLLLNDTKCFFLTKANTADEYNTRLREIFDDIEKNIVDGRGYIENGQSIDIAFVMDGPSFKFFDEANVDQRRWLLRIGKAVRSVIACRLTPIQKQQVVRAYE